MALPELGPDENGTRIIVRVGDTVPVRLPEPRTRGVRWERMIGEPPWLWWPIAMRSGVRCPAPPARGCSPSSYCGLARPSSGSSCPGWQPAERDEEYVVGLDTAPGAGG
jgi:hypothetical protein